MRRLIGVEQPMDVGFGFFWGRHRNLCWKDTGSMIAVGLPHHFITTHVVRGTVCRAQGPPNNATDNLSTSLIALIGFAPRRLVIVLCIHPH
jgi:hypothetical protein